MNLKALIIPVLAAATIVILVMLLSGVGDSELYNAKYTAISDTGKDPSMILVKTTDEYANILPLMAEIMSKSNSVVISIDAKDFEFSDKEIASYKNILTRLRSDASKSQLSSTLIQDYIQSSNSIQVSMDLINANIKEIEELKQFAGTGGDTEARIALLAKDVELAASTYESAANKLINIASEKNLDTTSIKEAIEHVKKIAEVEAQVVDNKTINAGAVAFDIAPLTLKFGERLNVFGNIKDSDLEEIFLCIDSKSVRNLSVKDKTAFSIYHTIGKLGAGKHFAAFKYGPYTTEPKYFTVETMLSLLSIGSVKHTNENGKMLVNVSGVLRSESNLVVPNAPITLYSNETGYLAEGITDAQGVWRIELELEEGTYNIYAEFSDAEFPLDASISRTVEVKYEAPSYYYIIIIAVAAVLAFVLFRFFRVYRKKKASSNGDGSENIFSKPKFYEIVLEKLRKMIPGSSERLKEQLSKVYKDTISVVCDAEGIKDAECKTPREILAEVSMYSGCADEFMLKYEYLYYSGVKITGNDMEEIKASAVKLVEAYNKPEEISSEEGGNA